MEPKSIQRGNKETHTETSEDVLQVLLRNNAVGVMVDQRERLSEELDLIWLKERKHARRFSALSALRLGEFGRC